MAIGLMAGPERPPVMLPSFGLWVLVSMAMPQRVLIKEITSAPAFSASLAIKAMSVTLGDNLTITGRLVAFLTVATNSLVALGSKQKSIPPLDTLGQEMLTSIPLTNGSLFNILVSSSNSLADSPAMLTITGVLYLASVGRRFSKKSLTPLFCRPMELSMPEAVSQIRGGLLPWRGSRVIVLVMIAPSLSRSTNLAASSP